MAKTKDNFSDGYLDISEEISAKDLIRLLKIVVSQCPDAVVTIRQTAGTDFPPFISIESLEFHDDADKEGDFENLLN